MRTLIVLCLGMIAAGQGARAGDSEFPFRLEPVPALSPGPAGSWDAGGVWGPRVIAQQGTFVMLYTGQENPDEAFDNTLAIGVATSRDGITWKKYPENPIVTAQDLNVQATGVEAVAVLSFDADEIHLLLTAVSEKRSPLGHYPITLATATWHVEVGDPWKSEFYRGDWNGRFQGPETLLDDGSFLGSGCCGSGVFMIGRVELENSILEWWDDSSTTEAPFAKSDPVFRGSQAPGWDRDQVFNPFVFDRGDKTVLLYSGTPGASDSATLQHTIGYALSVDGVSWTRGEDDNRLVAPEPGALIEFPYMLQHKGQDLLYVSRKPYPKGPHEIYLARGELMVWSIRDH